MTTIVPIEHPVRGRRGLLLRVGARLGEATPLPGRSRESFDDVLRALTLGEPAPPSLDFARWALDATFGAAPIRSQVLLDDPRSALDVARASKGRAFKLKIRLRADAEIATELRVLAPEATIRVDANRAFASESDVPWDELARASVEWIEEPCPGAGSLSATPIPIALDESVEEDADRAIDDARAGRVMSLILKPTLLGATATLRIARACLGHGSRVVVSHAFESEVGRRAAEEIARRVAPNEIHGLHRWSGIDAYRFVAHGAPLGSWLELEGPRADPALG